MRDTVTLDGITITRQQYDELGRKFNEPESKPVNVGDIYVELSSWWLVGRDHRWFYYGLDASGTHRTTESVVPTIKRLASLSEIVSFYRQHHPEAGK